MNVTMKPKSLSFLFVSRDLFPPFRVDVAVLFGKEMINRGHTVDWVLQSEADCQKAYKTSWTGGEVWVGPTNNGPKLVNRAHKHLRRFVHTIRNSTLVRRRTYNIVLAKDSFFSALIYLVRAKLRGVKFIYWLSYPEAEASFYVYKEGMARYPLVYLIRGVLYKFLLYKLLLPHADHIFVQSEQMRQDIKAEGIAEHKMTAIAMGVDPELLEFDKSCERSSASSGPPVLVYLGTLIRLRRIDFIIRVLAYVLKEAPDARLYLVGGADAEQDIELLRQEARELGILDAVIFTGFLDRRKAFEIVKTADVCLSPFYPTPILNSTSPTKLVEYMALGKAVVANDHPEQKSILRESGGGLCVPFREPEFAAAIIYLLKNPDVRAAMGEKAKSWIHAHRVYEIIAGKVENACYNCLMN